MEPFHLEQEQILQLKGWQQSSTNLVAGMTTKNGGVSKGNFSTFNCGLHVQDVIDDVLENRERLAALTGFPLEDWVAAEQVHGKKVQLVSGLDKGKGAFSTESALSGIDGILTKEKGVLLIAFYADCIPLYFYDPEEEIIGIAHAGWKGTVNQIGKEMITRFKENGSKLENIQVTIGPGISQEHYEVDERVVSHIDQQYRDKVLKSKGNQRFLLNLKELNKEILLHSGILRHNIDMTNYCTYRDKDLFFSYRRDQGKTGRMLGFIGMRV
ncbi:peptidoglycan editing factor PgeF [Oceanobacillus luteolus]|uniref:peptidoglycan editing factor PgeF n=1 Tax=Oceanobacillus luteolus TaxID=1274358 RepID=UPI00203E80EF